MPNYNYVIDSSFNPFSMEEMLTPFASYKEAYDKAEDTFVNLMNNADTFSYLAKVAEENPNSKAAQIYKAYADEMNKQFDDFSKHGLNSSNNRGLLNLKRRYNGEIGMLEAAKTALDKENELRRNSKDSSMLYAANDLTIDDFLGDNTPNLYNISGMDLYQLGEAAGKAYSSRIYDSKDAGSIMNGAYREYVTSQGYDPDRLNQWQAEMLQNGFKEQMFTSIPELQEAFNNILEANGVNANLKGSTLEQAKRQLLNGIMNGAVYNVDFKPLQDEMAIARYKAGLNTAPSGIAIDPISIYSQEERNQALDNIERYKDLFIRDENGNYVLNKAGLYKYNTEAPAPSPYPYGQWWAYPEDQNRDNSSSFKKLIDSLGGADFIKNGQLDEVGKLWSNYITENKESAKYDATKYTEYNYNYDSTQRDEFKGVIQASLMGNETLKEVDFDNKTHTFKPTGKNELSVEDLKDCTILSSRISPYGSTLIIQDKKGTARRYEMPYVGSSYEENRDKQLTYLGYLEDIKKKGVGTYTVPDEICDELGIPRGYKQTFTKEDLEKEYSNALQNAYRFHSQIGFSNKTEEQKFNLLGM